MLFRNIRNQAEEKQENNIASLFGGRPPEQSLKGEKALKVEVVYACIRILSGAVGKLPIKVYQDKDGKKKASDHYLYRLLKVRPNEFMSSIDFFECLEVQRNLHGNAFAYIDFEKKGKDKGKIKGLYPLDSSAVEIYVDKNKYLDTINTLWYVVTTENGEQVKLKSSEILHFKHVSIDGIQGISPIDALKHNISNAAKSSEYINNFYSNGMQSKGILHYVGDLDDKSKQNFRKHFEKMSSGLKNAHRISLLPVGYQYTPLTVKLADAQFLENNQLTIRQIAATFGIKNHQLNDLSNATHTNITEQQREFYIDTLMEILSKYEQELNFKLFTDADIADGYYVWFNSDAITRADIKTRYEAYRIGVQGGFLTPNEIREKEELMNCDGGDDLYANGSFIRLKDIGSEVENE